jgi:hypothetical protein
MMQNTFLGLFPQYLGEECCHAYHIFEQPRDQELPVMTLIEGSKHYTAVIEPPDAKYVGMRIVACAATSYQLFRKGDEAIDVQGNARQIGQAPHLPRHCSKMVAIQ